MKKMISPVHPRIANPTNTKEDFADKWTGNAALEHNFFLWVAQAEADFTLILSELDKQFIQRQAQLKFAVSLNDITLSKSFDIEVTYKPRYTTKVTIIDNALRPWHPFERSK